MLLRAFTYFYPLCKLSSSEDLVVRLVLYAFILTKIDLCINLVKFIATNMKWQLDQINFYYKGKRILNGNSPFLTFLAQTRS